MRKFSLPFSFLLISTFSAFAFSQSPVVAPTPSDEADVVKISASLIQIDVTVTDKKGNQVTDLKPEDFEILENGEKQDITNFSYVLTGKSATVPQTTAAATKDKISTPPPAARLRPERVRRTYALVVDDLGLSFASTYWVKQALKKFINEQMQEGDLAAILRVSGGVGALQAFTSDKRVLLAAADRIRWRGLGNRVGVNSFEPVTDLDKTIVSVPGKARINNPDGTRSDTQGAALDRESEASAAAVHQENFAVGSLAALNYVIRGMRELPGRKSLLFFSEGFQTFDFGAPGAIARSVPTANRVNDILRAVAELATRSGVIIYTFDPRGLTIPADLPMAADGVGSGSDPALNARGFAIRDMQNSLRYLARETGGIPYVDRNDWDDGIQKALDDQQGYYLIGYQPDSETFDPQKNKFNELTVRVNRPDLKIRYRSGFFGVTDEKYEQTPKTPQQKITAALLSPFGASDINLGLYSIFYKDHQDRNLIRSLVYIDPKDLTFTPEADGSYRVKFDVTAMIFDSDAASAGNNINSQELKFTAEQYAKLLKAGIIYDLTTYVEKTGGYQFRVAFRDAVSGKIGAASQFVEVPNLGKKKLTLSNLIVKNYSIAEWEKIVASQNSGADSNRKNFFVDTAVRRFKRGTMVAYSYIIYNIRPASLQNKLIQIQARLFRNGQMLLQSAPVAYNPDGQSGNPQQLEVSDVVTLGTNLEPGDYVLQLIVSDAAGGEKRVATQSVDFEIIE